MTPDDDDTLTPHAIDDLGGGQRALAHALRDAAAIVGAAALPSEYRRDAFVLVAHRLAARPLRDLDLDAATAALGTLTPPAGRDTRGVPADPGGAWG